jgi:subtilisin family serine protease
VQELIRSEAEEAHVVGNGFLNCRLTAENIVRLAALPSMEYAERLERCDFMMNNRVFEAAGFACGADRRPVDIEESGKGVLIGIIDSGIDLNHICFKSPGGQLRVLALLEQAPKRAHLRDYNREELEHELAASRCPGRDSDGHGTHVASIAAGYDSSFHGVALGAEFLIVQSNMMDTPYALDWIKRKAIEFGRPCVVNCSFGHHYGPHDGTHAIERHAASVAKQGTLLVAAAGNSGLSNIHSAAQACRQGDEFRMAFDIDASAPRFVMSAWYSEGDDFDVEVVHPPDDAVPVPPIGVPTDPRRMGRVTVSVARDQYAQSRLVEIQCCIYMPRSPESFELENWGLFFHAKSVRVGKVHSWIVHDNLGQFRDGSLLSREATLTIPGTSEHFITVGSFAAADTWETDHGFEIDKATVPGSISRFSSRGPLPEWEAKATEQKPDIVAPGEWVTAALSSGASPRPATDFSSKGLRAYRGTSQAAPVITGLLALLLEAKGNLTLSQAKAILRKAAMRDDWTGPGLDGWDNAYGFGKVNAVEALATARSLAQE